MGSVPAAVPAVCLSPADRTVADEDADREAARKRVANQEFKKWPNEAGFEGLREERGPLALTVVGTIPAWAAGNLYRTGPAQRTVEGTPHGTYSISHWFDGLAQTHRFEISTDDHGNVAVAYSSRRQSEARMQLMREQGGAKLFSFAQRSDPCVGLLGKFMTTFQAATARHSARSRDTQNVNVVVCLDVPGLLASRPQAANRRSVAAMPVVMPPDEPVSFTRFTGQPVSGAMKAGTVGHRALPDSVWITTDANMMRRVDPATLEPIGMATQDVLHPSLKGPMSSAHAQRDPVTGDFYNFNLDLGATPTYRVFCVSATTGKTTILATIRCRRGGPPGGPSTSVAGADSPTIASSARPAYIHSFFLTDHYVVLCIPCTHVAQNGLKILWERNVLDGLEPFRAENKTRWLVVDRVAGRGIVAELESPAGFFFHSVNAYEETAGDGDSTAIVCDVVDYPTSDILHALYYDVLLNQDDAAVHFYQDPKRLASIDPSLSRYRLRLPSASVSTPTMTSTLLLAERVWTIPGPHAGELPTIHPGYATRPHRFVYGVVNQGRSTLADALCKTDTATRSALLWQAPHGHTPGEAIFVPRPGDGLDEDDGVLLSVILDGTASQSYLLCLNARTMQETGRAEVGFAIGLGFHGVHRG